MKLAAATTTPEVTVQVPVSLFTGNFSEKLNKAVSFGYDGIEILALDPQQLDVEVIVREIKDSGLEVAAVATGVQLFVDRLSLLGQDPEIEKKALYRFHRLADFAMACGAPLVTIGSFRGRLSWGGSAARERLIRIFRECAEKAQDCGIRIAVEPLNRYETDILFTVEEGKSFLENVGHKALGLLLDTFHMNIEETTFADSIQTAGKDLLHVHLGDSNRLSPGRGHIDFEEILANLHRIGYNGYLSAELLALPDPDTAARETAAAMQTHLNSNENPLLRTG